jgi:hypothetical protein
MNRGPFTIDEIKSVLNTAGINYFPTQLRLSIPIINRIAKKMSVGLRFKEIQVLDQLICDGHHRFVASLMANYPIEVSAGIKTSATIQYKWQDVVLEEGDWDTPLGIKEWNKRDAHFNGLSFTELMALLK